MRHTTSPGRSELEHILPYLDELSSVSWQYLVAVGVPENEPIIIILSYIRKQLPCSVNLSQKNLDLFEASIFVLKQWKRRRVRMAGKDLDPKLALDVNERTYSEIYMHARAEFGGSNLRQIQS